MKNVAGYDLGRLVCGSFGSLAAIVSATFKLAPLPAASTTLVAAFGDRRALAQAAQAVGASQLEPAGVRCPCRSRRAAGAGPVGRHAPAPTLLIQFASTAAAVEAQIEAARRLCAAADVEIVTGAAEADRWREQRAALWDGAGQ